MGRGNTGGIKRAQQDRAQEEVNAEEEAGGTHSTVWMVHVVVAPALPDRRTEAKKSSNNRRIRKQYKAEKVVVIQ